MGALLHESVQDTHRTFWRPNLLPDDRLGFKLAQLSHPVQYVVPDPCLPLLRFVAARAKAVSDIKGCRFASSRGVVARPGANR